MHKVILMAELTKFSFKSVKNMVFLTYNNVTTMELRQQISYLKNQF